MNDRFQFFSGGQMLWLRAKHQPSDFTTIDFSRGIENSVAKSLSQAVLDRRLHQDVMSCTVSFDNFDGMFFAHQPGKMALAATNATNQTNHRNNTRGI